MENVRDTYTKRFSVPQGESYGDFSLFSYREKFLAEVINLQCILRDTSLSLSRNTMGYFYLLLSLFLSESELVLTVRHKSLESSGKSLVAFIEDK